MRPSQKTLHRCHEQNGLWLPGLRRSTVFEKQAHDAVCNGNSKHPATTGIIGLRQKESNRGSMQGWRRPSGMLMCMPLCWIKEIMDTDIFFLISLNDRRRFGPMGQFRSSEPARFLLVVRRSAWRFDLVQLIAKYRAGSSPLPAATREHGVNSAA